MLIIILPLLNLDTILTFVENETLAPIASLILPWKQLLTLLVTEDEAIYVPATLHFNFNSLDIDFPNLLFHKLKELEPWKIT